MPIYTKKGDKGETGLPGKRRLSKTDQLFEVLGTLDQTNATIGVALANWGEPKPPKLLTDIQSDLLSIGSYLASQKQHLDTVLPILENRVGEFEKAIDQMEEETGQLQNFILAGGSRAGAQLHLARTISRQAEREYHRLAETQKSTVVSQYLNRLSDYLFQTARFVNYQEGAEEAIWILPQNNSDNS